MSDHAANRRSAIRSHAVSAAEQAIKLPLMSRGEALDKFAVAAADSDFTLVAQLALILAAMEGPAS